MKRQTLNITALERMFRILIGTGLVLSALSVVSDGVMFLSVIGALLMGTAGPYLVLTGLTGYCPFYARIGYLPPSLRG